MRLNKIEISNYAGARNVMLDVREPVCLISGANGAGKSSVKEAIKHALLGDGTRVSLKKDFQRLVSDGELHGFVSLEFDCGAAAIALPSGKQQSSIHVHDALPLVLDGQDFASLSGERRAAFLYSLLGIETSHKAIGERLTRKGLDEQKIAAVLPVLRAGFAAGEKHAKELASQSRGAWKAVTGETYGDKKADGWEPPPAAALAGDPVALAENAKARASEADEQIAALQQELGAARATWEAAQQRAARMERLREQASMVERIKGRLATAEENVASCKAQIAGAGSEDPKAPGSYLLRGMASALNEFVALTGESHGVVGYHLNGDVAGWGEFESLINRSTAHLGEYRKVHGDPDAELADPARLAELRHALQVAESGAANARRDLAAAEAARAELDELEKAAAPETPRIDDIEMRLTEARRRRADWQADAQKYLEAAGAAERRAAIIADAARHHADVQQWSAIADALSPDGIQAEMIAEALDPLNATLAEHAALAQWQPPRIGPDMLITVGGRAYSLCSESERWRADALIALTIAQLSGLRFVVLDRLDVLDATGREDALFWLSDLAEAGQIGTAIVLATLKSAPSAAALPAHIASHWIERGTLIATHTNQQALEAA